MTISDCEGLENVENPPKQRECGIVIGTCLKKKIPFFKFSFLITLSYTSVFF